MIRGGRQFNFSFAFNDSDFSDRTLRLEISPDDDTDSGEKIPAAKYDGWFSCLQIKDSESSSDGAEFTGLHISSPILAAQSPFFYKMFKNGMKESHQKTEVCLKIKVSEEAILMDLLRFMYGETALKATSFHDLVDLLMAADKFGVTSCMSHCVEMLRKFPMTQKHALFYLELPSSVLVSEIVKPLIDAAKQHVFAIYKYFTKSQKKAIQLPLSAIEFVLGSEGLQVESEDVVFNFVLKWARASYPEPEERREILTNRLVPLICFPNMSVPQLKEVLAYADFDDKQVTKLVHEALFSKIERSCGQFLRDSKFLLSTNEFGSIGRVYNPHCVVFFDLTKLECEGLFPFGNMDFPEIRLGNKRVYLSAHCGHKKNMFGLYLMRNPRSETCTLKFEIAVMKKSSLKFEYRLKVNYHTVDVLGWRLLDQLGITWTWTELMSDDSDYFIDGVMRIRAELTLMA